MKAPLIVAQRTVGALTLFVELKHNARLSLCGEGGTIFFSVDTHMLTITHQSFSVLPAISLNDGILACNILEGSFCTETFENFIKGLLDDMQPYPGPNSIIVMDNCRIHKHPRIQEMIRDRYFIFYFLWQLLISKQRDAL